MVSSTTLDSVPTSGFSFSMVKLPSALGSSFSMGKQPPRIALHSILQRQLKYEDIIHVDSLSIASETRSMLYMVCDGHSGVKAAKFVAANIVRILNAKLPGQAPNLNIKTECDAFAGVVRKALCETFIELDNQWLSAGVDSSGTTLSVVVLIGSLLSVAGVGDSTVILDTGSSILEMTGSHRLQVNKREQERLRKAGCCVAPLGFHLEGPARPNELSVGPLRMWPGGLCVSRSIGDLDAGNFIIPMPHVRQVLLPPGGARIIAASDGLWDLITLSRAAKVARTHPIESAATHLVETALRDAKQLDDCSMVIVDFLPRTGTNFPTVALKTGRKLPERSGGSGGFFSCFRPEVEEPDSRDVEGEGFLAFLSDLDCLEVYPELRDKLERRGIVIQAPFTSPPEESPSPAEKKAERMSKDLTMHRTDKVSVYRGFLASFYPGTGSPGNSNHTNRSAPGLYDTIDENGEPSNHSCPGVALPNAVVSPLPGGGASVEAKHETVHGITAHSATLASRMRN